LILRAQQQYNIKNKVNSSTIYTTHNQLAYLVVSTRTETQYIFKPNQYKQL